MKKQRKGILLASALLGAFSVSFMITGCDQEYASAGPTFTETKNGADQVTGVGVSGSVTDQNTGLKLTGQISTKLDPNTHQAVGDPADTLKISDRFNLTENITLTPSFTHDFDSGTNKVGAALNFNGSVQGNPVSVGLQGSYNMSNSSTSGMIVGSLRF